jgi:hypothetical protein
MVSISVQMKTLYNKGTTLFGVGEIKSGFLTLGSASNDQGQALRFRAVGVASELNGRVQFYANLQELDEIGVVACMVTCERSELPQKVWVSARVEEGRITGLGKTNLLTSEVMGVLGGVLQDLVLFIDPLLPIGKAAAKSAGKRKNAKAVGSGPVKKDELAAEVPADAAPVFVSQDTPSDLATPPVVDGKRPENTEAGKDEIRPLHDRVEVLNPQALDSFPCTSSRIPILENVAGDKASKMAKGRKKKQGQEQDFSPETSSGDDGVHSTDGQYPEAVERAAMV